MTLKNMIKLNPKINILLIASILTIFGVMVIPGDISAETNQITVTPINEKVSLEKTSVDSVDLVESITRNFYLKSKNKGISIESKVHQGQELSQAFAGISTPSEAVLG